MSAAIARSTKERIEAAIARATRERGIREKKDCHLNSRRPNAPPPGHVAFISRNVAATAATLVKTTSAFALMAHFWIGRERDEAGAGLDGIPA